MGHTRRSCLDLHLHFLLQGADYVEFDVHLSKDLIPVVYHDFNVCLTLKQVRLDIVSFH